MSCKLTSNITKSNCQYTIAGVKSIYLINYDERNMYLIDTEDKITDINLADGDKAYKIDFADNTASYTDDLAVNGNGGKYRTHTLNFTITDLTYQELNQGDKLSLSKFTAVVVDKSGHAVVLGRNNGLSATSFNYASGAAEADARGWTVVMAGTEIEVARQLSSENVLSTITDQIVVMP